MEQRKCKNCDRPIPASKRSDAIFCCAKCGWDYRNREKRHNQKEKRDYDRKLNLNYKIITALYIKGKIDVPVEGLEMMGYDMEVYTSVISGDPSTKISIVKLFEYHLTFDRGRCKIEKPLL